MRNSLITALIFFISCSAIAGWDEAQIAVKKGDYPTAVREYTVLADKGDARAQLILGALYNKGGAVPRDDKAAASWFQKAAQQGSTEAQYWLGKLYEDSQLPQDYSQAANWYQKAAQQGLAKAQVRLGHLYSRGLGVSLNYNEAILWYGKAALQGDADAEHALGLMYMLGKGLPKNQQVANGWLTKAAAQNHADSQLLLGGVYEEGNSTDRRPVLAYALYEMAITNKTSMAKEAIKKRDTLAKKLSAQQLDNSKKLVAELSKPQNFSKAIAAYLEKSDQLFRFFPKN